MAISDILSDAAHDIEQARGRYELEVQEHIQCVLDHMAMLRMYFDIAPGHPFRHVKLTPTDQFFAPARHCGQVSAADDWPKVAALFEWEKGPA